MKSIRITILFVLLASLTACGPTTVITPTPTLPQNTETPTPAPVEPSATPEPAGFDPFWEDRTIFSPNLIQGYQAVLEQFPQASYYVIDLSLPDEISQPASGHLKVRYTNLENQPLEEIIFRLFANYNGGQITTSNVQVDMVPVETSLEAQETTLVVHLPQDLPAGQSIVISMDFNLTIPTTLGGNYGLFSYTMGILVMDLFYPMIPAYDSSGWYREYPAPSGDLSYNDMSFYRVNVSAPESMVLVASGSLIERTVADGRQQATFAAGPARDFYLAGSTRYTVLSAQVGETTINSYAPPGFELHQQYVLEYLVRGMSIFNDMFGVYPYTEFDAISSPMNALGIEYPGVVGIYQDLYIAGGTSYNYLNTDLLETVVIHELGHQWFYNVVGNDQQDLPWVDESITQYAVYLYMQGVHGQGAADERLAEWYGRWEQLDYAEIPIGLRVRDYAREAYSPVIYGRGPLFFYELSRQIGEGVVWQGLVNYFQQNAWQIATTHSIRSSLEQACQCDLSEMFNEWIYP